MKHWIGLVLLASALVFSACADDTSSDSSANNAADANNANATVHTVTTADGDMTFTPDNLTIAVGDIVEFQMTATHNAVEVSKETFDSQGLTPLEGGFNVDFSETQQVTFNTAGTYYYICQPHVMVNMIGTITVE